MNSYIDLRAVAQKTLADFSESNLYLLLDHGGLPGLHRKLQKSSAKWASLFDCMNEANALVVAPILILIGKHNQLQMSRSLFEWIGKNGTYTSTVIMLSSPLHIEPLKKRLTARLDIKISEDMRVLLRFFDPRTFEGLTKVLSPEQLTTFLAPAERWWYIVRIDAAFNIADELAMPLILNAKQELDLIDASEPDRVLASLRDNVPDLIRKEPIHAQYDFVAKNLQSAHSIGLTSIADLVVYNVVALIKGIDFIRGEAWSRIMDDVKSKPMDFMPMVSSLNLDEERRSCD
jgi:hypothetical protein